MNHCLQTLSRLGVATLFVFASVNVMAKDQHTPAEREVLGAVDALFDAMAKHDVDASRKLILPGAGFMAVSPEGTAQMKHDTDYLDSLAKHKEAFRERIWNPKVLVQGGIAQVWAPYDFHLDGKFSHCGIDSFSLVRSGKDWQVASVSYTVQKQGCPPSPLGELK
ncbi:nuclear transport factor 2 family protein [Rhodanobacter sp. C05]|uniref:nuclear transport factor 2 family protein n=1 Tax=Rhodanobacter sp. C05 TaxID=1945855 RepID=UPI0009870D9E|nr:nuclear transport factor 2 family protein [Rhodanobacter sp. C05]OOG38118.1 hypothetical protein B0E51_14795 [Rhodanobacter sp. C05]